MATHFQEEEEEEEETLFIIGIIDSTTTAIACLTEARQTQLSSAQRLAEMLIGSNWFHQCSFCCCCCCYSPSHSPPTPPLSLSSLCVASFRLLRLICSLVDVAVRCVVSVRVCGSNSQSECIYLSLSVLSSFLATTLKREKERERVEEIGRSNSTDAHTHTHIHIPTKNVFACLSSRVERWRRNSSSAAAASTTADAEYYC